MTGAALLARVFPGSREQARTVRAWVRAQTALACPAAVADAELTAAELAANAITHTRSGQPGGTFTVAVTIGRDGVKVHVHDLGADGGQEPRQRPADGGEDGGGLAENGRGLAIVAAVSAQWGTMPAFRCPVWTPGDPATVTGGRCVWATLATPAPVQHGERKAAQWTA